MPRIIAMQSWLETLFPGQNLDLAPASSDASFRRYFRLTLPDGSTRIVMDAPPEHEDCGPFIRVASLFAQTGIHVPTVLAQNLAQGYLLLSDLGHQTYLSVMTPERAPELYGAALQALVTLQQGSQPGVLPPYDRAALEREMDLFPHWYADRHLGRPLNERQQTLWQGVKEAILARNLAEGQVYVHRDYHSRNLMCSEPNPGVLDFQDALYGPISYDLVSLLKDAYIQWDEEQVLDWCIRYWERARRAGLPVPEDFGEFYRDFEWMGLQRHLKVLGIFARLYHRDGKDGYLKDLPLVLHYVVKTCQRYRELQPLLLILEQLGCLEVQTGYTF